MPAFLLHKFSVPHIDDGVDDNDDDDNNNNDILFLNATY